MYAQQVQPGQLVSGAAVGATQLDITSLITSIMPLIMLIMVMQMMKPLLKGMTTAGD